MTMVALLYGALVYLVFFKFKQGIGEKEIVDLEKSLAALPPVIPEILSYEFGRDVVRSERCSVGSMQWS